MAETAMVTVEFFGIPRLRAGQAEMSVSAGTVADVLAAVERACPGLAGLVQAGERVAPHYLLSLDGAEFVSDLRRCLHTGDRLLLFSADAGG